jgi:hypothetical protein
MTPLRNTNGGTSRRNCFGTIVFGEVIEADGGDEFCTPSILHHGNRCSRTPMTWLNGFGINVDIKTVILEQGSIPKRAKVLTGPRICFRSEHSRGAQDGQVAINLTTRPLVLSVRSVVEMFAGSKSPEIKWFDPTPRNDQGSTDTALCGPRGDKRVGMWQSSR